MINRELKFDPVNLRYHGIIGTGGIGSGRFFVLNGDHTLGREESRSGHFLNINDYCKQHIILHYIKVLLGNSFEVIPAGKTGSDDVGQKLSEEMKETGFNMNHIRVEPGTSTLFSFCFYYPDGSGGNMTTDNSASSKVDAGFIEELLPDIKRLGSGGIVMAAPEVPLAARIRLIELGRKYGMFCTASFTTGEIREVFQGDILGKTDLVALNLDEAAAVADSGPGDHDTVSVVKNAVKKLMEQNPRIMVSITAGRNGSWCWDGSELSWFRAIKAEAVSTAGAGDAFFSGLLTGTALGLPLSESQKLAALIAGLSVCSPDTINREVDRSSLRDYSKRSLTDFSNTILKLLEE